MQWVRAEQPLQRPSRLFTLRSMLALVGFVVAAQVISMVFVGSLWRFDGESAIVGSLVAVVGAQSLVRAHGAAVLAGILALILVGVRAVMSPSSAPVASEFALAFVLPVLCFGVLSELVRIGRAAGQWKLWRTMVALWLPTVAFAIYMTQDPSGWGLAIAFMILYAGCIGTLTIVGFRWLLTVLAYFGFETTPALHCGCQRGMR